MDVETSATILAGTILTALSFIIVIIMIVIINNILHKYWKPVKLWHFDQYPARFAEPQEITETKTDSITR